MDRRKARKGIRPHGSGIQIDFVYNGRRFREKLAIAPTEPNLKHAERLRNSILFEISQDRFDIAKHFPKRKASEIHLQSSIDKAFDNFLKFKKTSCAVSTFRDYKSAIDFHLRPTFGHLDFSEVTPSKIRDWLSSLQISQKRKNNILIPLREIFNVAYRDEIISTNPLDRIENFRHTTKEPNPFSPFEIDQILNAASGQIKNLFKFAFYTGLRTSELIALRWSDIDLKKGIAFIRHAKVRKILKTTKTAAGIRNIKLFGFAIDALEGQQEFRSNEYDEVFLHPKTLKPWIDDAQIRKTAWYPLLENAHIEKRNPYQTRHTFASLMLTAGEDPFWVSRQLGHKNLQMTLKRYARWINDVNDSGGEKAFHILSQLSHKEALSA